MADHPMNKECIEQFAIINTNLKFHKEWRDEVSAKLKDIQSEVEKLTGNGNRGKIDDLRIAIEHHIARSEASQHRIEELEARTKKLESRLFTIALQVAGAVGAASLIIHFIINKMIG